MVFVFVDIYIVSQELRAIMEDAEEFYAVFGSEPNLAYQEQTVNEISKHRRSLENELFFDRLLKAVGIDQGVLDLRCLKLCTAVN